MKYIFVVAIIGKFLVTIGTILLFIPIYSTIKTQRYFSEKIDDVKGDAVAEAILDEIGQSARLHSITMTIGEMRCAFVGVISLLIGSILDIFVFIAESVK